MPTSTRTIAGVERAMDVLDLFADSGAADLGVTEIAERLDLSKAVVHRILSSFRVKGFVELDDDTRRYRLGPQALRAGMAFLNRSDAAAVGRGTLEELADVTGETVTQSVRAGWSVVCVAQVPSPRQIRVVVQLGQAFPLHAGCASRVLLAHLSQPVRDAYLSRGELATVTSATPVDRAAVERQLDRVRVDGYAVSYGEREPGVGAVAAPVLGHDGTAVAAVAVTGPEERFRAEVDGHVKALLDAAERASRAIGWLPPAPEADPVRAGPGPR